MIEGVIARNQVLELEVESAAFEGMAVGRHQGFVVFVRHAVPGDRLRVRVVRKKKRHAEAVIEEILSPSPYRVEPRCPYFSVCGGCNWQNVDYEQQLAFKTRQVDEIFRHLGGFEEPQARPTLAAPSPYYYRNKMEFTFGTRRWLTRQEIDSGKPVDRDFALGLHLPGRFDRILDLETCFLQSPRSAELVNRLRDISRQEGWSAYDTKEHRGYLRNLVIRVGHHTGEWMVHLVTSREEPERTGLLSDALLREFPEITTFVNTIHPGPSPVPHNGKEVVLHGPGYIQDRLGRYTFRIAPATFFQPNTVQAERLYEVALDFAALDGEQTLYDLYSGIGGVSLFFSERAGKVVGVENQPKAVQDAICNAQANGVSNCFFYEADVSSALTPAFMTLRGKPDVVVIDPPRVGIHPEVCKTLIRTWPERVVYISCNPATQARDLKLLSPAYRIEAVQPVDMFPQTYHIENVVLLVRKK